MVTALAPSALAGTPTTGLPSPTPGLTSPMGLPPMPTIAPELVSDPGFSGGYAFESMDPMSGSMSRNPVDWGSLKKIDWSKPPPAYAMGAVMLGDGGEILVNRGDSMTPNWQSVGSLYGSSIWSDPAGTGGALSASLPSYTPPATPLFGAGGMYGPDPMAAMMSAPAPIVPATAPSSGLPGLVAAPTSLIPPAPVPATPLTSPTMPLKGGSTGVLAPTPTTPTALPHSIAMTPKKPLLEPYAPASWSNCDPITGKCSRYA
jgi:hypothetical protein